VLFSDDPAHGCVGKAHVITDLLEARQFTILFPRKEASANLEVVAGLLFYFFSRDVVKGEAQAKCRAVRIHQVEYPGTIGRHRNGKGAGSDGTQGTGAENKAGSRH
jgi:hypothetical protein